MRSATPSQAGSAGTPSTASGALPGTEMHVNEHKLLEPPSAPLQELAHAASRALGRLAGLDAGADEDESAVSRYVRPPAEA